jgi:CSLREA domain-containing protein
MKRAIPLRTLGAWPRLGVAAVLAAAVGFGNYRTVQAASIAVTTAGDELNADGDCSLREAVRAANLDQGVDLCPAGAGADTITLASQTYTLSVAGRDEDAASQGDLDIIGELTLVGTGEGSTTISGGHIDRVLDVRPGARVTLFDLAIQDGTVEEYSGFGGGGAGARVQEGKLLLQRVLVHYNSALGVDGGGLLNDRGELELVDSTVSDNVAGWNGGGIASWGALKLAGTTIRGNLAQEYYGGGVISGGPLTIADSTFINNQAPGGNGFGGGLHTNGEGAVITNTTFTGNLGFNGGGVFNQGTLTLTNSTISGNSGIDDGGGIDNRGAVTLQHSLVSDNQAGEGGGIFSSGSSVTLIDTTLSQNQANGFGGNGGGFFGSFNGLFTFHRVTIRENNANNNGGGIHIDSGTMVAEAMTLEQNKAGGHGGGLYTLYGSPTIQASTIAHNQSGQDGGGMWVGRRSVATVINSTLSQNQAAEHGGAIATTDDLESGIVSLNNVTIAYNVADSDNNGSGDGGGIANGSYSRGNRVRFRNTILGRNSDRGGQSPDCTGRLSSYGYNLIYKTQHCTISNITRGNIVGKSPRLGALQFNGGPTMTHRPLSSSPVIDRGSPATVSTNQNACAETDQRGVTRPRDGNSDGVKRCDIGAVERRAPVVASGDSAPSEGQATSIPADMAEGTVEAVPADDNTRP